MPAACDCQCTEFVRAGRAQADRERRTGLLFSGVYSPPMRGVSKTPPRTPPRWRAWCPASGPDWYQHTITPYAMLKKLAWSRCPVINEQPKKQFQPGQRGVMACSEVRWE